MPFHDGPLHEAPEEGQQQRTDVSTVHVGVGHDDDAMVAELLWIEGAVVLWIVAHTSTEGSNHGLNLVVLEDFRDVALLALDVQDLAAEGQNGLNATVAARLG